MPDITQEVVENEADFQGIYDDIALNFREAEYKSELSDFEDELYELHADSFALERDPNLSAWPPLAAATIARKGHDEILFESGRLRTSLTTKGGPGHTGEIFDRGLSFGTDVPYSIFHQQGTRNMPQRAHVGMSPKLVEDLTETITKSAVNKLRKSR